MLRTLKSLFGKKQKRAKKARRRTFRPSVDSLEQRRLLAVLFVDDNLQQFPAAPYTTIQAAVNAAQPGDTIKVFAGKYNEAVVIPATKPGLVLSGAGMGPQFATNPQLASIIDNPAGTAGRGLFVQANDTVVTGFTLADLDDNHTLGTGIETDQAISGFTIAGNVVTDNWAGMIVHSNGAKTSTVAGNWIYANQDNPENGNPGIYSYANASNIHVVGNTITDHATAAMYFRASLGSISNLRIEANTIGDASRANSGTEILLANVTNSRVSNNTSYNSINRGIDLAGLTSSIVVSNNTIVNPLAAGIDVINGFALGANTQAQITGNRISGSGGPGIRFRDANTASVVSGNTVTGSRNTAVPGAGNGILIDGSSGIVVTGNTLTSNFANGILVTAISTGNTFTSNVAVLNGNGVTTFDLTDLSTGAGTAGTANFWASNTAIRRNRPGI